MATGHDDALCRIEGEAGAEDGVVGQNTVDGINVTLVGHHNLIGMFRSNEDVAHVQLFKGELHLVIDTIMYNEMTMIMH